MKVLIADKLSRIGLDCLRRHGVEFDDKPGMSPEDLAEVIGQYDGVIIRSGAKLTADVLARSGKLRAIARAGVGVDNVDLAAATARGIVVMNTPGGNTVSTAELALTLMMTLSRMIVPAAASLADGRWDRKKYQGTQLAGKTLGVIGLGRVGRAVAMRAVAMEMKVMGYDPMLKAEAAPEEIEFVTDVNEVYERADYITVHVPRTEATRGMISTEQFEMMKPTVRLVNAARGGIIDESALLKALEEGKVAGAALDVYTSEPPAGEHLRKLISHPHVVAVPHLGASTSEAQEQVALEAAEILVEALRGGEIRNAVNVSGDTRVPESLRPYVELANRMGTLIGCITPGAIEKVVVAYRGAISDASTAPVTTALLIGLLRPVLGDEVNIVNAPVIAKERGIVVETITSEEVRDFTNLLEVELTTDKGRRSAAGTILGHKLPRIVSLDGYSMEMIPAGNVMVCFNDDKPGVIGAMGNIFGQAGVNIAQMTCGRKPRIGKAALALNIDSAPSEEVIKHLQGLEFMTAVYGLCLDPLPEDEQVSG